MQLNLTDENLSQICEDIFANCDRLKVGYLTKSEVDWGICEFFKL